MKGFSRFVGCVAGASLTLGLFACGDTVENTSINQIGMEVVDSEDDLPKCTDDNEGDVAYVKDEDASRVCVGGDWKPVSSNGSGDFSCKTVELKDGSGLKIVCNGDSIGVVLNGSDGKAGKDGEDGKDAVLPQDTLEADSERVAISLDSLTGFTQKGPFLKGSTVYLYELSDGRTLKQTNGNFTSKITSDNGRYKFSARDLVSQYAMVVVDGYYRNEVTGGTSDAPIRLTALTDMRKRSSVNVNLLTHMEFDRVYNLVTRGDSTGKKLTVKAAKRQAQKEILKQFHIELGDNTDAEDMDVFGDSDADAALLAVSVLLQGDSSSSALSVLLTEISNDISGYGEWKNAATKAKLADWALTVDQADSTSRLTLFGKNVTGWGLGNAPDFGKFVRNYASIENGLGICGSKDAPEGTVKEVPNAKSDSYYAAGYTDTSKTKVRFVCRNEDSLYVWRAATNLEKDSAGWGHDGIAEGTVRNGKINPDLVYVYENGNWRHGTDLDSLFELSCIQSHKDTVLKRLSNAWYKCVGDTSVRSEGYEWKSVWRIATDLEKDTVGWAHTAKEGDVKKGRINTSLTYVYENGNWRHGTDLDTLLNLGCIENRRDTLKQVGSQWYKCVDSVMTLDESEWKTAWREVSGDELDSSYWKLYENTSGTLLTGPYSGNVLVWDDGSLRKPSETELAWGKACVSGIRYEYYELKDELKHQCTSSGWSQVGSFRDKRDDYFYNAVHIGEQIWMAENLNYASENSKCQNDTTAIYCDTRGRGYTYSAALKACPTGWHLPDTTEWSSLRTYSGVYSVKLRATAGWKNPGTDDYGFAMLPDVGSDYRATFWTATYAPAGGNIGAHTANFYSEHYTSVQFSSVLKTNRLSVRCLKNE